jgi:putative hydrolase of the HAD superfamily
MNKIRNIIFDFGMVIINIDPSAVRKRMAEKGVHNVEELHARLLKDNIYHSLETGAISPDEFRAAIKNIVDVPVIDADIDDAWNAMILDIPPERLKFMTRLKSKYKLYLLSNTNAIHWEYYNRYFQDTYDYPSLNTFFSRAWYSYLMGVRKPDPQIFRMALEEENLDPSETAFIDDLVENVDAAARLGISPCHLPEGKEIMDLFDENLDLIV